MAQILADRRDIDFVLHEQLKVEELAEHELFSEFNRKAIDLIVSEARTIAKDAAFYDGQIRSAEFYTQTMIPVALGRMDAILSGSSVIIDIPEDAFGGR